MVTESDMEAERREILRHKWLESEKAGHDVGWEWARTDWISKHRVNWWLHRHDSERRGEQERKRRTGQIFP